MMKRLAVPVLVLCVALMYAVPGYGAIQGTAHELAIGSQGTCSACHIPHKSAGARLWPVSMTGVGDADAAGTVGALCYYCHGTGGGANILSAVQDLVLDATSGALSHGMLATSIPSGDSVDATLPYGSDTLFQCTTCHNVHDDTNQPFLQDDIDVLCARCHNNRQFVGGSAGAVQGNWGANYGLANPGSHPMGQDVYQDSDGNSPVDLTADGRFNLAWGPVTGHNLGGHLIDGGTTPGAGTGMTCVTCHAPHGVQDDNAIPGNGTYNQAPVGSLLVVPQPTTGGPFDDAYNGNGDATNALCEACHLGTAPATTIDVSEVGGLYTGSNRVNPGNTAGTHPVDDLGASGSAAVSTFPTNWPVGSTPGTNVSPAPLCESCHTPHPNANSDRATILTASGTHILRGSEDSTSADYLCVQCHDFTSEGAGHHPYNVAMGRMADAAIGNGDATLTCDDCHGSGSGAHNWTGGGIGLDPDWEPAGNAKGAKADEQVVANASKECVDCHIAGRADGCPTNNSANDGSAVSHAWRTGDSFEDIGEGTHYLGTTSMDYSLGSFLGSAFDASPGNDDWTGQGQANARWSRFSDSSGAVVCESCHELEADKNVPGTALLLAFYNDGGTGTDDDPSGLCEGCHGTSPGGTGTPHPMTGDTVTRTGLALTTTGDYTRGTTEGNVSYPAADALNCDSCHQPHDADTQGGTYIYESGQATTPAHDVTSSNATAGDARGGTIGDIEDAPFCDSCHFYLQ